MSLRPAWVTQTRVEERRGTPFVRNDNHRKGREIHDVTTSDLAKK
jgi:hypothetical protein